MKRRFVASKAYTVFPPSKVLYCLYIDFTPA